MGRKSALIKVSGDLQGSKQFLSFVRQISENFFVVVCVGGDTQISSDGIPALFGPLGRELTDFSHKQRARDILENNQVLLQDTLADEKIPATVIIPAIDVGSVLCHVNGDTFIEAAYLGFDVLYVITTPDRIDDKRTRFKHLPKVTVVACSP
jgi:hypothetical protein